MPGVEALLSCLPAGVGFFSFSFSLSFSLSSLAGVLGAGVDSLASTTEDESRLDSSSFCG